MRITREHWNYFVHETVSPMTLGGGAFNAAFSQLTNTDPKYGVDRAAFGKRFGASIADIVTRISSEISRLRRPSMKIRATFAWAKDTR